MADDFMTTTEPGWTSSTGPGVDYNTDITLNDILDVGGKLLNTATGAISAASPFLQLSADITKAGAQQAAAYYQQGMYEVQAIDTLRLAQIRTDQDQKYASIQAGRKLKQAEMLATPCCGAWSAPTQPCVRELLPMARWPGKALQHLSRPPMWGPHTATWGSQISTP